MSASLLLPVPASHLTVSSTSCMHVNNHLLPRPRHGQDRCEVSRAAGEQALEAFGRKWDGRFPSITKSWQANWQRVIPFFAYPPELRKGIYITNAIESINASLRKVKRKRGAFQNSDSVRKVLYLAILKASARGPGRSRTGWRR